MSTVAHTLLTAEEFLQIPEPAGGMRQELVRGKVITMPPPGAMHGAACVRTVYRLSSFIYGGFGGTLVCNDAGFITARDPDSVRGPDVSYWSKERLQEIPVGYIEIAPDLLVEVLSPSNTRKRILEKLVEYFARGVRLVWVLAPEDRTLTIYRTAEEGRLLHETATLTGEEVLPGFECRVSELLP